MSPGLRRLAAWLVPALGFLAFAGLVFWRSWSGIHDAMRWPGLDAGAVWTDLRERRGYYPFDLLLWPFAAWPAVVDVKIVLHAALAGLGGYAAARAAGASRGAATAAGAVLLVPPAAMGLAGWNLLIGFAWLPWVVAAALRFKLTRQRRYALATGVTVALALLAAEGAAVGGPMPPRALWALLVPTLPGPYLGELVLAAALAALVLVPRAAVIVGVSCAALLAALWLDQRAVLVARVGLALVAALGLDALAGLDRRRAWAVWLITGTAALVALVLAVQVVPDPNIGVKVVAGRDAAAIGFVSVLVSAWLLVQLVLAEPAWRPRFVAIAALALALDVWFAHAAALDKLTRPRPQARSAGTSAMVSATASASSATTPSSRKPRAE